MTKSTKKSASSFQAKQVFRLKLAALAIAACFAPLALANPVGPVVVNGAATVVNNGNTMTVTNTPGAILNWQQFNIGQGQTTQFNQQSVQSSVLNRVVGPDSSQILGTLRSNGRVFLINQNGIMFGAGSVLDVNGLIASTLNISNTDFLLNRMNFSGTSGTSVVNQGTITTPFGGSVYLIGNNVTNQGVITTPQGQVVLAAGNSVSLVNTVTPHVSVTVSAGGQALNLGQITAQGGSIDIYGALIQQQGIVSADSASVNTQGAIVLAATQSVDLAQGSSTSANGATGGNITIQSGATGSTNVAGSVEATGSNGTGGNIQVLGNSVVLTSSATLNASGTAGGGTILVGGDYQGKNAAVQNAFTTTVAQGATLKADATLNGNGGKIIAWSDNTTHAYGSFSARGGAQSGNGGLIETSGHYLDVAGIKISAAALNGAAGTWLLDPINVTISTVGNIGVPDGLSISDVTISTALGLGTSVSIITSGNMAMVGATITGSNATLTLQAAGDITMDSSSSINGGSPLNVTLIAGGAAHLSGYIYTAGGDFNLTANTVASIDGASGAVYTNGGAFNLTANDFWLGGNQTIGTFAASAIDTTSAALGYRWVGANMWQGNGAGWVQDSNLGGNITINTNTAASVTGQGVRIGANSEMHAGSGLIQMIGHNYQNDNTTWPLTSTALHSVNSHQGINMIFDHMSAIKDLNANDYGHLAFMPLTSTFNVLITTNLADARCGVSALCLGGPNTSQHNYANTAVVLSQADIIVDGGMQNERLSRLAAVALHDIILNSAINIAPTWAADGSADTNVGPNLLMVAGNNFTNNVGAAGITQQAGHGWVLFARDSTTSQMNGLVAPTVLNLGQDPALVTTANILGAVNYVPAKTAFSDPASPYYNPTVVQLTAVGGAMESIFKTSALAGDNIEIFWGTSPPTTQTLLDLQLANACLINPLLCSHTSVALDIAPALGTDSLGRAIGKITYSSGTDAKSMGLGDLKKEARKAEEEADKADDRVKNAKTPKEKEAARKDAEKKRADADSIKAEVRAIEANNEAHAADAEVKAAKTPEEKTRAEMRKAIAETKQADAEVKKAEAESKHAEVEAKTATDPQAKAAAEAEHAKAETKKVEAEVKKAEADVKKVEAEVKQAEAEAKTTGAPEAKATVETKQAAVNVAKAETEVKQAEAAVSSAKTPEEKTKAQVTLAAAETNKAKAEANEAGVAAKQADDKAKASGSPVDKLVAETKKADAEAKNADTEVKAAKVEAVAANNPADKKRAEEKVALAETKKADKEAVKADSEVKVAEERAKTSDSKEAKKEVENKKADAEVKKAEAKVKNAEENSHKEKDSDKRKDAEHKVAEAKAEKAEAEANQADHEAKEAREEAKAPRSVDGKVAAMKKAEASEVKSQAKHAEAAAAKLEAEAASDPSKLGAAKEARAKADVLVTEAKEKESEFKEVKQKFENKAIESFGSVDVAAISKSKAKEVMAARHEFKAEALKSALNILKADPRAADLKPCGSAGGDVCIRPVNVAIANIATNIIPRVQLPLLTPTTSFLPAIQRKVAVVIGNNAYQDPDLPSLNGAAKDADAVGKMFQEKMGYDVRVVHNGTRADIIRTLNQVSDETGSKDSVVVYYAGHGYQMEDTKAGYWLPSDASAEEPSKWISNSDINKILANIPAKQMILISDSCFSGTLASEQKVTSSSTGKSAQEILGKRSVLMMSSGGEEPVVDAGKDDHSVFAWHLMDKLDKVEQYKNGAEVFDAVKAGVAKDLAAQTPQYGASVSAGHMEGGEYLFEVRKY